MSIQTCLVHSSNEEIDASGCIRPANHFGPHECVDDHGNHWLWETDMNCDCDDCEAIARGDEDGPYCELYWNIDQKGSTDE